jgi:hypothetical protein
MLNEFLAKAVLIPYLWFGGYDMDKESLAKCHDAIEIQCRTKNDSFNLFASASNRTDTRAGSSSKATNQQRKRSSK